MKNGVTWSASDNGIDGKGLYKRPKKSISGPADATITAASISDPSIKVTAIVHLVPHQDLAVHPASVSVFTSQQIPFRAEKTGEIVWKASRSDLGTLDEKTGVYTAPGFVDQTEPLQITATDPKTGARAAAVITVNAPSPAASPRTGGCWSS